MEALSNPSPPSPPVPKPKPNKRKKNAASSEKKKSNAGGTPAAAAANASLKRSSIYRGVTRHRWTGRYEAHLWDKCSWNPMQNKKGRQVYLGAYDDEEAAAHTYDLAALKYWGPDTVLNFPASTYSKEFEEMKGASKEEYLATLRRRSSGFSRGVSKYRGVARHHHNGRWEARIGRVHGNKYLYLGTFSTQEEAAQAYDMAALEFRGPNAVTNFDVNCYIAGHQPQPNPMVSPSPPSAFEAQECIYTHSDEELPAISGFGRADAAESLDDFLWPGMEQAFFSSHEVAMEPGASLHDFFDWEGFETIEHLFEAIDTERRCEVGRSGDGFGDGKDGGGGLPEDLAVSAGASSCPPVGFFS